MKKLIGIDVGTSALKAILMDETGAIIRTESREYPLYQPKNGWAEQNPEDWWDAAKSALAAISDGVSDIAGIGLTGQMHGLVMLDAAGEVLRPAIIWCDGRTSAECDQIHEIIGRERLIAITANPALPGFTASKILWVKHHEPEIFAKCRHILLPKDYIRYKLTGVFATEVSDAGGMQLLDIAGRCWSNEVLDGLEIPREWLGEVYESPEITGYVTLPGVCEGVPVVGGAGDNAAAAVGCGVVEDGRAFTTIGTSGVVFAHTDKPAIDPRGRVHTFCCAVPGKWHVMGVTQSAGLSLKWFREQFAAELSYREIDELAAKIPVGCDRLLYLPYLMGERTPHLDANARGVFFGMSAIHTRAHFLRAVLEGVAYSLRDCVEVLREMGIEVDNMTAVGGGASPLWCEILAGTFDIPIRATISEGGPSVGAAILAGVGAGVYESVESACRSLIGFGEARIPADTAAYDGYYQLYRRLYPALKDSYSELARM
ncbi:MAG: xylulokinase [Ruminococcaceae bacterium]|nr:xylulokinase [Oscillospiraceae bacterium]